jgi:hypothetical protein
MYREIKSVSGDRANIALPAYISLASPAEVFRYGSVLVVRVLRLASLDPRSDVARSLTYDSVLQSTIGESSKAVSTFRKPKGFCRLV